MGRLDMDKHSKNSSGYCGERDHRSNVDDYIPYISQSLSPCKTAYQLDFNIQLELVFTLHFDRY